jgi:hypothetical protein
MIEKRGSANDVTSSTKRFFRSGGCSIALGLSDSGNIKKRAMALTAESAAAQ